MLSKVYSAGLIGTDGFVICCEVDVFDGLPGINMIGYLASQVREAQDRVKTAVRNSSFYLEPKKIVINLSPADTRKEGCGYDLSIAVAMLLSYGYIRGPFAEEVIGESLFIGELSLGGELLCVHGILPLVLAARESGFTRIFIPEGNAAEAAAIDGIDCFGISDLRQMADILNGDIDLPEKAVYVEEDDESRYEKDFSDVFGQELVKRATTIAVAGRHNILYVGPAGTGKSMIASRIPSIMPKMSKEERLEISKLYSICGLLSESEPLLRQRPFRHPHHTISAQALSGGGTVPKPGEISLASGGVLFLDELAEFRAQVIETLRQPMEDRKVTVSRIYGSVEYPADFVLCAATNPCKCGFYPDRTKCSCTEQQVQSYLGRISKPIFDRIDICVETLIPKYDELNGTGKKAGKTSAQIREEVERVRLVQSERFRGKGIRYNSEMNTQMIEEFCGLSRKDELFIRNVYEKKNLSARGLHKILKVARTIADYDGKKDIEHLHLAEAISYRSLEEKLRGGAGRIDYRFQGNQQE